MYSNQSAPPNIFNVVNGIIKEHHRPEGDNPVWHYNSGDDLFWAALAHICYNNAETRAGLLKHFDEKTGKLYRSLDPDEKKKDNCSRDLLTMFLTAIALTMSIDELRYYANALLKVRISKRYIMTPSLYMWVKFLATGKAEHAEKFYRRFNRETKLPQWWTLKLVKWYNLKEYDGRNNYNPVKPTGFTKVIFSTKNDSFSFHLSCWQLYVMEKMGHPDENVLEYMLNYLLRLDNTNVLCIGLIDRYSRNAALVHQSFYSPRCKWRWECFPMSRNGVDFGGMCDKYLERLSPEQSQYNTIDKDILSVIK